MEIAILVILVIAAVWAYNFYLKPKNALDSSTAQKDSSTQAASHKTVDAPKPDAAPAVEKAVVSEVAQTVATENSPEASDEEQMLQRHHLHNIRLMVIATTFPQPTDSTLSRHYDEMIDAKAEDCLNDEAKMARLVAEYEESQNAVLAEDRAAFAKADSAQAAKGCCQQKRCAVPEDSALRRHYLTTLRAKIEKNQAPRPTDSTLRRHYDAMINAALENHLACH